MDGCDGAVPGLTPVVSLCEPGSGERSTRKAQLAPIIPNLTDCPQRGEDGASKSNPAVRRTQLRFNGPSGYISEVVHRVLESSDGGLGLGV